MYFEHLPIYVSTYLPTYLPTSFLLWRRANAQNSIYIYLSLSIYLAMSICLYVCMYLPPSLSLLFLLTSCSCCWFCSYRSGQSLPFMTEKSTQRPSVWLTSTQTPGPASAFSCRLVQEDCVMPHLSRRLVCRLDSFFFFFFVLISSSLFSTAPDVTCSSRVRDSLRMEGL